MMYGYGHGHGMGPWGWFAMLSGTLLTWALLAVIVAVLYRLWTGDRRALASPAETAGDPESILAARFARGDIDETEYRSRLDVLRDREG